MSALDSFDSLMDFATNGREYRHDEVWISNPQLDDPSQAKQVVGNGFDIERPVSVLDNADGKHVEGTFHFRVLHLTNRMEPRLLVRTRLEWTTSSGVDHTSSAYYNLTRDDTERLDESAVAPTPDQIEAENQALEERFGRPEDMTTAQAGDLMAELFGALSSSPNAHCDASWDQSWSNDLTEEELLGPGDLEARLAEVSAESDYHVKVIYDLFEREEPLACMLSDSEFGAVYANELVILNDWVQNNVTS